MAGSFGSGNELRFPQNERNFLNIKKINLHAVEERLISLEFVNILCSEYESNILFQKFWYPLTRMQDVIVQQTVI
jgi:hypothetical protein